MHRDSILVRLSSFDNCETGGRRRRCCSSCNAGMKEAGGKMISLTKRTLIGATIAALALIVTPTATRAQSAAPALANFEPSQTNPIRLSADGKLLFAVNTANSSLSVFDVTQPARPGRADQPGFPASPSERRLRSPSARGRGLGRLPVDPCGRGSAAGLDRGPLRRLAG